uniref:Putative transmembrane protein n=1 Tax=Toxoplasma gondii TgCATBr9 TaxID=943120 RepID=A0A2T6IPZ0_TOXGO|nr:putative transmembrane protein [Toxoplasma gondii TgCATBr9]
MLHHVPKKAQESARGFSFCDRCGLPRGTKNCHACESLSLQPGQRQMNPQWEARDDHQIGHLLRHGQALSFFPPLQCISKVRLWLIFRMETVISPRRCCRVLCPKILFSTPRRWGIWMWITLCICFGVVVFYLQTSHADAAFCCYPRYLEYCLELVEEKFAVVEEKLEMLMEFADSINKKRSSEEERRLASLDWMVKEVLKVQLSDFDVTVQRSKGIFYEDQWLTVRCIS